MNDAICAYCRNKEACGECDKLWKDKFMPSDAVAKYFKHGYNGVRGVRGYTYDFDTTNPDLKPTHTIMIGYDRYCAYCGEPVYAIQDRETLTVIGHCCICDGARAELEYEEAKKALEDEYAKKLKGLQESYAKRLAFSIDKLFEQKRKVDEEKLLIAKRYCSASHFATLNGKPYTDIEQMF